MPSLGGARFVITFTDEYSDWKTMFTVGNKSEVFEKFVKLETFTGNHIGKRIKGVSTDRGGEYMPNEFNAYLSSKGIVHQLGIVENPHQNGVSERVNRPH